MKREQAAAEIAEFYGLSDYLEFPGGGITGVREPDWGGATQLGLPPVSGGQITPFELESLSLSGALRSGGVQG